MKKKFNLNAHFTRNDFHTYLVKYVARNYKRWAKKYIHVVGVDVGKKTVGKKITSRYAIVFHVIDKTDSISPADRIPPYFTVNYRKAKKRVPTDVVRTGESTLQYITPGRNVFQLNNANKFGTMGCILDLNGELYVMSNMHVLGWNLLGRTRVVKNRRIPSDRPPDISSLVNNRIRPFAYLVSGVVDERVDAAIALIPPSEYQYVNARTDLFDLNDPIELPHQPVTHPIPVKMMGAVSGFRDARIVSTTANKTFPYPFGPNLFTNIIALSPCISEKGDSGSAVFEPISGRIVGIVLGRDEDLRFTYVIAFPDIQIALEI